MFNKIKKIRFGIFGLAVLVALCLNSGVSTTKATVVYGQRCTLGVYPYNQYANHDTIDNPATQASEVGPYVNMLSTEVCNAHLTYPNQYLPQPPNYEENQIKSGASEIRAPIATHEHAYFNDSDSSIPPDPDRAPNGLYFYKSFIDRFEITIQPDGYGTNGDDKLFYDNISCDMAPPIGYQGDMATFQRALDHCNGPIPDMYGGTMIEKSPPDPVTKTIKITWYFATGPNHNGRPSKWGNNGRSFAPDPTHPQSTLDLTNPFNRVLELHVKLPTRDNGQIWSATTTSKALIADLAILQSHYGQHSNDGCQRENPGDPHESVIAPNSGWCYLPSLEGSDTLGVTTSAQGTQREYYWYTIGSVASIWKKPPPPPSTLRLIKHVVNRYGGTARAADFPLYIGPTNRDRLHATSGTVYTLPAATYRASEDNRPGYQASVWSGDCSADGRVTLNPGENKTCEITNSDIPPPPQPPTLTLVKRVENRNGGTARVQDFPLFITNTANHSRIRATSGTSYTLTEGTFAASEQNRPGYRASIWSGDCNAAGQVTLHNGEHKQCVITNSDIPRPPQPATLTLVKQVINDDGGTARPEDFPLFITPDEHDSLGATTGVEYTLDPRHYAASEENLAGYVSLEWSGDCAPDGSVQLAAGEHKRCVITNNDIPVPPQETTLTLIKTVVNDGGGTARREDFPLHIVNAAGEQIGATTDIPVVLAPGHYTAGETSRPEYSSSGWGENCNSDGGVDLQAGDHKVCQITNTYVPPWNPPPPPPQARCESLSLSQYTFLATEPPIPQTFTAFVRWSDPNAPGTITWEHAQSDEIIETRSNTSIASFSDLTADSVITVRALPPGDADACTKRITPEIIPIHRPSKIPAGFLTKGAFEISSRGNVVTLQNPEAQFKLTFRPLAPVPELILKDIDVTRGHGIITGTEGGKLELDGDFGGGKGFKIDKNNGAEIPRCPALAGDQLCYEGTPFINRGITVWNVKDEIIHITYRMRLTYSNITNDYCKGLRRDLCGEQFVNNATARTPDGRDLGDAAALLYTPCPFLMTQGIGDVILERDLSIGSDILSCSGIPNIEGPTIEIPEVPEQPLPGSGGSSETISVPSHSVCQQSNEDNANVPTAYKNPIKSLSSAVCEMSLTLADVLTPPKISENVLENISRITRFNNNLGVNNNIFVNDLDHPFVLLGASPNPNFEIYKLKNGNLTIPSGVVVGPGSRTYVIEGGDLIINGNISYQNLPLSLDDTKQIPSIAFIVIDGNIRIEPNVTHLSGVFVTLKRPQGVRGGKVCSLHCENVPQGDMSKNSLTIEGSVYGDIEPLFGSRSYTGNARQGQGTISINYDGRLFYSMPPGLKEILKIAPEQVAR